jgi:hypothetical protein
MVQDFDILLNLCIMNDIILNNPERCIFLNLYIHLKNWAVAFRIFNYSGQYRNMYSMPNRHVGTVTFEVRH